MLSEAFPTPDYSLFNTLTYETSNFGSYSYPDRRLHPHLFGSRSRGQTDVALPTKCCGESGPNARTKH